MTSGVADSVEHAAAAVAAAAAEIRVIEDAHRRYSLLGRLAAFAWRLPWPRLVSLFATTLALVLAALWLNRGAIARAFDAYVTRHALTKLRGMLTPEVSARRVRLRWNTVSVEGLTIGNSPAANFANAPSTNFLAEVDRTTETTYYDSVTGKPLFIAPRGRSFEAFEKESRSHGWPSFRDEEVVWENVRCLKDGEAVSVDGTHLGHNLPDRSGNRYCINLVSVAGSPVE